MSISKYSRSDVSLRMLLENPELLGVPIKDELSFKKKDFMTENNKYDVQSAFLVPNIWQETIPPEYLDLSSEAFDHLDVTAWLNEQSRVREANMHTLHNNSNSDVFNITEMQFTLQTSHPHLMYQQHYDMDFDDSDNSLTQERAISSQVNQDVCCEVSSSDSSGSLVGSPSKNPAIHGNTTLKDIVGDISFDPSKRSFTSDELKVLPILPKSRKNYVPSDKKDDHYWSRRIKNNTAAKRSREAKRMKENQITLRTAYLEQENARLKNELMNTMEERDDMKKRLMKYEYVID